MVDCYVGAATLSPGRRGKKTVELWTLIFVNLVPYAGSNLRCCHCCGRGDVRNYVAPGGKDCDSSAGKTFRGPLDGFLKGLRIGKVHHLDLFGRKTLGYIVGDPMGWSKARLISWIESLTGEIGGLSSAEISSHPLGIENSFLSPA